MESTTDNAPPSVEPAAKSVEGVRQSWRALLASATARERLTAGLRASIQPWWHPCWQDGRLVVQRQLVGVPAGAAFEADLTAHAPKAPPLGSPRICCDGERIWLDEEPADDDLLDDLAYVAAKVAKSLNWRCAVARGSRRFADRFNLYTRHESDFFTWAGENAKALRALRPAGIDWENLAEEVEDLGRSERRALKSQLHRLLLHLLKWENQPARRSESWRVSVENARDEIRDALAENPGLEPEVPDLMEKAYRLARREARAETGLAATTFPPACPWTFEQVIDNGFWPGISDSD